MAGLGSVAYLQRLGLENLQTLYQVTSELLHLDKDSSCTITLTVFTKGISVCT